MQTDFWLKMRIRKEKTLPSAVGLSDVDYSDFREEIKCDKYKKYDYLCNYQHQHPHLTFS